MAILRGRHRDQLRAAIPEEHVWHRSTGGKEPKRAGLPRVLQRALSQHRAGRSPLTNSILHRFGAKSVGMKWRKGGRVGLAFDAHAYVTAVTAKSPAATAGVKPKWRLEAVGAVKVATG